MNAAFFPDNRIELLETGSQYFPALHAAIEAAQEEVRLEAYIFADDATGRLIAAALARAARRGVAVHLLVDGYGSRRFMESPGGELAADGVEVLVYGPDLAPFPPRRHRLRRLHRKLALVDGRVAFAGGINIVDDLEPTLGLAPRYDYAVRIEGPLVAAIHKSMTHLWQLTRWLHFRHRLRRGRRRYPPPRAAGEVRAAFVWRDHLRHRRDIEDSYLAAIDGAKSEIILANAYFLPGRRFRQALMTAARRGVKVTVLLQGRVEYRLVHYATQFLYGGLLAAGVRIYEYRKSFLHAKVAVIDGYWATVGSSNIDPFSLLLAREANIIIEHAPFAGELRASLQKAITLDAIEVVHADLRRRSPLLRLTTWFAYSLVRLGVGVASRDGGERSAAASARTAA